MAEYVGQIIIGLGSAITAILGGTALLLRARSSASKPKNLLERLWDWIEAEGLVDRVPVTLRHSIRRELDPEGGPDDDAA